MFLIYVEGIISLLLHNLHGCTFKGSFNPKKDGWGDNLTPPVVFRKKYILEKR